MSITLDSNNSREGDCQMRVLLTTYGSRGDVQPMVALALALRNLGADIRLCAPPDEEIVALLERNEMSLIPAFASVRQWVERARQSGMKLPQLAALMIPAQYEILSAAAEGCDAVVATGLLPSVAAAQAAAEIRGVHFSSVHFCQRYLPSPELPPVEFPGWPHPPGMTDNRSLWAFNLKALNALFGEAVNVHRAAIGLPAIDNVRDYLSQGGLWQASDFALGPWHASDMCAAVQTGAWILPDTRPLPPDLAAFLEAGSAPVYVGFGSMPMLAAPDAARTAVEAVRVQGRRVLIARGRAGLDAIDESDDCFVIGEVNQQALFPRMAAVVHHGGAGTTTAAARAGAPQVIVPQVADQPYWAGRVSALGIGAAHDGPAPDFASLSACLSVALAADTVETAARFARSIRIDGATTAAEMLLAAVRNHGG
jgi:vancomycin aglycone glucosyltransferase